MEVKKEFYHVMTVHTAAIYHEVLKLDFILEDGQVKAVLQERTTE